VAKGLPKGIEPHYRDSFSTPEYAAKETEDLFKTGAPIVIGGATSAEAKWMIPVAEKMNKVIISPSASEPGLAASSNLFFRMCPPDDVEGAVAANFVVSQRKARTILVLYQKGTYGEAMLKVFKDQAIKLGAKVTAEFPIGPTDWEQPIGEALTTGKPDAVFIGAFAEETLAALGAVRNAKFPGTICVSSAFATGDVLRRAGASADGVAIPMVTYDPASQKEPIKSFAARFKAANKGAAPDLFSAYGYDAATVALQALQDPRPKDTAELLQRVMSQGATQGVTGRLSFDSAGDTTNGLNVRCIKGGKFENCPAAPAS